MCKMAIIFTWVQNTKWWIRRKLPKREDIFQICMCLISWVVSWGFLPFLPDLGPYLANAYIIKYLHAYEVFQSVQKILCTRVTQLILSGLTEPLCPSLPACWQNQSCSSITLAQPCQRQHEYTEQQNWDKFTHIRQHLRGCCWREAYV